MVRRSTTDRYQSKRLRSADDWRWDTTLSCGSALDTANRTTVVWQEWMRQRSLLHTCVDACVE
jgi:hypothetical protein